jgi:hypothetical protein
MNFHNSLTSATPKVGVHLGIIGLHPLHSSPFVKVCFIPKHILALMGPCTSHLVTNPILGLQHSPTPKVGVHLGMCGLILQTLLHSWECECDSWVAFLAHTFLCPCFDREPKARVMTRHLKTTILLHAFISPP